MVIPSARFALPAVVAGLVAAAVAVADNRPLRNGGPASRQVGMNLGGIADWSSEWPFVDAFKTSRPWIERGQGPFTYDDRGNPLLRPGQRVETLLFRDVGGHYPPGIYVLTWDGGGQVEVLGQDVVEVVSKEPRRVTFRVQPANGGIHLAVTSSPPRDPVHDIRVWVPGYENAPSPFHPLYVERLRPFRVVRFMDWQKTNGSPLLTWSQRPRPDAPRYSTNLGVPVEIMIDLANACQADAWFCVPHQADDDSVREFARLVKARLDPSLRVYVEYSNEVWNAGFAQSRFAEDRGKKLGVGEPESLRYYAQRSCEVFDVFSEAFGEPSRVVRVLSGHFASPWASEVVLSWKSASKKADAFAVGAYFGHDLGSPKSATAVAALTADQLLDRCQTELDSLHRSLISKNVALAKRYNLPLIAYEGGQHLVGHGGAENNAPLMNLFHSANRHPRMYGLYRRQMDTWFGEGGGLFAAFSYAGLPNKWGSWGVLEYQDQPVEQAPKYRGLIEAGRGAAGP